jgi:hypothetical protein
MFNFNKSKMAQSFYSHLRQATLSSVESKQNSKNAAASNIKHGFIGSSPEKQKPGRKSITT